MKLMQLPLTGASAAHGSTAYPVSRKCTTRTGKFTHQHSVWLAQESDSKGFAGLTGQSTSQRPCR